MEGVLNKRSREILKAVVHTHILTGYPVGSRTIVKKYALGVSPATVRNVMSDLEEMGYLTHPHTSAGRIPTDKGFRFYVDELLKGEMISPYNLEGELERLEKTLLKGSYNASDLLMEASKLLSELSKHIGLVFIPKLKTLALKHIELILISEKKVLVILISESGIIQHLVISLKEKVSQKELEKYSQLLNKEFQGKSLLEMRRELMKSMRHDLREYDTLYRKAMEMAKKVMEKAADDEVMFHFEGASNIFSQKEFVENIEKMKKIFKAFEEKGKIVKLLDKCLESEDDVTIIIGSESKFEELQEVSLIASYCKYHERVIGTVGILGPKRMDYSFTVPLVKGTAQLINRILTIQ